MSDNTDSGIDFILRLRLRGGSGGGSTFQPGDPSLTFNGGESGALDIDISGVNRDSTTQLVATLQLRGAAPGAEFSNFTMSILDIDRGINDNWVDEVDLRFGQGTNQYTYDGSAISQDGDVFTGETNVPSSGTEGNLTIHNSGNLGDRLRFFYRPGEDDAFTSNNQRISLGSTITFDIVVPEPTTSLLALMGGFAFLIRRRSA